MFSAAERELGALDGVVINPGIVAPSMPLAEMDASRIRRVFEVNVSPGAPSQLSHRSKRDNRARCLTVAHSSMWRHRFEVRARWVSVC